MAPLVLVSTPPLLPLRPSPYHADLILANVKLVGDVVEHEGRGLTHHDGLLLGAPLDGPHHGPVA